MTTNDPTESWKIGPWHPDFGDPQEQIGPLRTLARAIILVRPDATISLRTPEAGLLFIEVQLPDNVVAEIHSVPSQSVRNQRQFAIFLRAGSKDESEAYVDTAAEAVELVTMSNGA